MNQKESFTNSPNSSTNSEKLRVQAQKKIAQISSNVPIIYSVRVQANLEDLKQLEANKNIRFIDIIDERTLEELNSKGIDETNVTLKGIIPDDTELFTFEPKEI